MADYKALGYIQLDKARVVAILTPHLLRRAPLRFWALFAIIPLRLPAALVHPITIDLG
jgi:hypothetical protein